MPNIYLSPRLVARIEALRDRPHVPTLLSGSPNSWTFSAMVRTLLDRAVSQLDEVGAAPPLLMALPMTPDGLGEDLVVMEPDGPSLLLCSGPSPLPTFRPLHLLYDELDGDAVPRVGRLVIAESTGAVARSQGVNPLVIDRPDGAVTPLSDLAGQRLRLAGDGWIAWPKRVCAVVTAQPGGAARGRAARAVHDAVSFRLYLVVEPPPNLGVRQ